jgi:hypothetical protein
LRFDKIQHHLHSHHRIHCRSAIFEDLCSSRHCQGVARYDHFFTADKLGLLNQPYRIFRLTITGLREDWQPNQHDEQQYQSHCALLTIEI